MHTTAEMMPAIGEKNGRAYIINEAHGLNRAAVRQLLTTLEGDRIPRHVVWIFTTTVEGEQTLFEGIDNLEGRELDEEASRIAADALGRTG